ncbi:hypothetical protein ACJA27_00820 [Mycoplasmopsis lipophila]|uniref:hypothetical protein n=1 Tax=Mycoplasmopsis lipophila TaxID=2117 RepID=UPI003872C5E8
MQQEAQEKSSVTNKNVVKRVAGAAIFFTSILLLVVLLLGIWYGIKDLIYDKLKINNILELFFKQIILLYFGSGIAGGFLLVFILSMIYIGKKRKYFKLGKLDKLLAIFVIFTFLIFLTFGIFLPLQELYLKNKAIDSFINNTLDNIAKINSWFTVDNLFLILYLFIFVTFLFFILLPLCFGYGNAFYDKKEVLTKKSKVKLEKSKEKEKIEQKEEPLREVKLEEALKIQEQENLNENKKQLEEAIVEENKLEKLEAVEEKDNNQNIEDQILQEEKINSNQENEPKIIYVEKQPIETPKSEEPQIDVNQIKIDERKAYLLERYNENQNELASGLYQENEPKIIYVEKQPIETPKSEEPQIDVNQIKIDERKAYLLERYNENQNELASGLYKKQKPSVVYVEKNEFIPILENVESKPLSVEAENNIKSIEQKEEPKAIEEIEPQAIELIKEEPIVKETKKKFYVVETTPIDEKLQQANTIEIEPEKLSRVESKPIEEEPVKETKKQKTTKKRTTAKKTASTKKKTSTATKKPATRKRTTKPKNDDTNNAIRSVLLVDSKPLENNYSQLLNGGYEEVENPSTRIVENKRGTKVPKATAAEAKMSIDELLATKAANDAKLKKATKKKPAKKVKNSEKDEALKKAAADRSKLIEQKLTKLINLVDDLDLDEITKK